MCRPQGNTNQDYEISLQNIKDILKTPVTQKQKDKQPVWFFFLMGKIFE